MNSIAIGAVLYSGAEEFVDSFVDSINAQSLSNVDVLIVDDGFDAGELEKVIHESRLMTMVVKSGENKIASNRILLINEAVTRGYKYLVFFDADDRCSPERVECLVKTLDQGYEIAYNSIVIMGSDEDYFEGELPESANDFLDIIDYNFIGLGNSAIRLSGLESVLSNVCLDTSIKVFDWYFYSVLLNHGYRAKRANCGITYYRFHEDNIAGDKYLNERKLLHGIQVKKHHYEAMKKLWPERYESKVKAILALEKHLLNHDVEDCINEINRKRFPFWWQNINLDYFEERKNEI